MTTFKADDYCFDEHGEQAQYVAAAGGGHVVRYMYERGDEEAFGEPTYVERVFAKAPTVRLAQEVEELEKKAATLRKAVNAREDYRTNPSVMKRAEYVAAKFAPEYCWLQAVGVDNSRSLPWVCVDCRTGTIHTFKTVDDSRAFAASEGIEFFL